MVVHGYEINPIRTELMGQVGKRFQRLVVRAADHRINANSQFPFVLEPPEQLHRFCRCFERALHTPDLFMHVADRRIDGNIHAA
jgi:hypothetical protein